MFISFGKIVVTFLILYLLSNSTDGVLTSYGNYQNIVTILMAFIGLSVQNGITTYTARANINSTQSNLGPHLLTIFIVGLTVVSLMAVLVDLYDLKNIATFIGLSEGRFKFFMLVAISFLGVVQSYYCAVLIGKGFVLQGQALDLLKNFLLLFLIGSYIFLHKELSIISIMFFSALIIVPFLIRNLTLNSNYYFKPKLDSTTIEIAKPGIVTMYSGVLVASATIFVRNIAIDYGGYGLSDLFEIIIRIKVMYHLVVSAPLALILLRSYASADTNKTFRLASKAFPVMVIPILGLALVPSELLQSLLSIVFNKELEDFKLVLLLLIGAETVRAIGLFFHGFLVSKAIILPQLLFATLAQIIIIVTVVKFASAETFIVHYFVGYLLSQIIWLSLNYIYVRSLNNKNSILTNS